VKVAGSRLGYQEAIITAQKLDIGGGSEGRGYPSTRWVWPESSRRGPRLRGLTPQQQQHGEGDSNLRGATLYSRNVHPRLVERRLQGGGPLRISPFHGNLRRANETLEKRIPRGEGLSRSFGEGDVSGDSGAI